MKFGAAVTLYNRDKWIGAYLEQLLSHDVIPVVSLSDTPWGWGKEWGGNEETLKPDRSEEILNKYFPEVKVVRGTFVNHRESFKAAIDAMPEVDRIILNDCDIFLEDKTWSAFLDFISSHHCIWKINHATMITEYYYNYNYGKAATPGGPPPLLAFAPSCAVRPQNMTHMDREADERTWDDPKFQFHHFRYCKPSGSGAHKCIEPTDTKDYKKAPEEICALLDKWDNR